MGHDRQAPDFGIPKIPYGAPQRPKPQRLFTVRERTEPSRELVIFQNAVVESSCDSKRANPATETEIIELRPASPFRQALTDTEREMVREIGLIVNEAIDDFFK